MMFFILRQIVAMTEMLLVAKRQGLDLNKVFHAIRASSGNSFAWETGEINKDFILHNLILIKSL